MEAHRTSEPHENPKRRLSVLAEQAAESLPDEEFPKPGGPLDHIFSPDYGSSRLSEFKENALNLKDVPRELAVAIIDLLAMARNEWRLEKINGQRQKEWQAVETIHREHFNGFNGSWPVVGVSETGEAYHSRQMEREGDTCPEHAIVGVHGWFGRYDSFAEQAKSEPLRHFSQIYYNRPGTDRQSAAMRWERGYSPADHMDTNIEVLEKVLERALVDGRKSFALYGHSMGGVVILSALDRMAATGSPMLDKIDSVVLANTSVETSIVNNSFIDLGFGSRHASRVALQGVEQMIGLMHPVAEELYELMPDRLKEKFHQYTPRQFARVIMSTAIVNKMIGARDEDVFNASKYRAKQNDPWAMLFDGASMLEMEPREHLDRINVPVFIVEGQRDRLLNRKTSRDLAKRLTADDEDKKRRVAHFAFDSGHCTQMEERRYLNEMLAEVCYDPENLTKHYGQHVAERFVQSAK